MSASIARAMAAGSGLGLPGQTTPFAPAGGNAPGQVTPMQPVGVGGPGGAPAQAKKETMCNATCSYPLFARPWREGYEKHLAPFDALFIDCSAKDVARGVSNSHQSYRLMNLPLLNTFLAKHVFEKRQKDGEAAANAAMDELAANLCFLGTNRNDEQLSGGAGRGAHPERSSAYRRLINFDCRGASRVRNLWPTARQGDRLAFLLVEVPAKGSHIKVERPTDPHRSRQADRSKTLQQMQAQLRYMRRNHFAKSACNQVAQAIRAQETMENNEPTQVILQCKAVVCRDGANIGDELLEPDETLRRVMDVGFVYEHVPRAFSPSQGAAKSAHTTFGGNDALPVIAVFIRT